MGAMVSVMNALVPTNVGEAESLARVLSTAKLVPDHLRNSAGDCLLVVMQAQRWGMDALSVAQCTSVVRGKLCYEGKLVAAVLYSMGVLEGRLRYEYFGQGDRRSVRVIGRLRGENEDRTIEGTVGAWATDNGNWKKSPDDMLAYRGARQWARRHAPEALLGVYTPDELDEDMPAAPKASLQPRAASDVIEGEARVVSEAELRQEREPPADEPPSGAPEQPPGELPAGMAKVLEGKLSAKGLSREDLQAGFGAVSPSNINAALKWIAEQQGAA
jgi:hypothetical protein